MRILFTVLWLTWGTLIAAQESALPIDMTYHACLDNDPTTLGMIRCAQEAHASWDAELNKVYQALGERLSKGQRVILRDAQRRWISFRDAEEKLANATFGAMDGTMWRVVLADKRVQITRERAIALQDYLDNYMESEN